MKQGVLTALVAILVLALGIETGYLIKTHQVRKEAQEEPGRFERVTPRPYQAPQTSALIFDDDPAWDPFREMEEMQRVMNRMFRESYSRGLTNAKLPGGKLFAGGLLSYNPDIDFAESDEAYVAKVDLPGIDKDNVTVKVEGGQLIISGERKHERDETAPGNGMYRSERSFGSFLRSMPLPADADVERMKAETKNGVLTVTIPRRPEAQAPSGKQIPVE